MNMTVLQDSEEIKSNSLDTQLKAKEELLLTLKLNNASGQEVDTDHVPSDDTLFYNIISLAGYPASLETLSSGLSPPPSLVPLSPLSYSSLPSTLPPSDYPALLRITAFPRYFLNLEA